MATPPIIGPISVEDPSTNPSLCYIAHIKSLGKLFVGYMI